MKKSFLIILLAAFSVGTTFAQQDKSKRASPPAEVSTTTTSGLTITINYSQPSVKGRTIGKEIAPYGKVWRTGANEATIFEVNKDVTVEGKALKEGKYSLYTIPDQNSWVIIFNKQIGQWGTQYAEAEDALRISVKPEVSSSFQEKMTFEISKQGNVSLLWGKTKVSFNVRSK